MGRGAQYGEGYLQELGQVSISQGESIHWASSREKGKGTTLDSVRELCPSQQGVPSGEPNQS